MQAELADLTRSLAERAPVAQFAGDLVDRAAVIEGLNLDAIARDRMQARAHELRAALERMDAGTYGKCELCGDAIGAARLKVLTATPFCVECARSIEADAPRRSRQRSIREEDC